MRSSSQFPVLYTLVQSSRSRSSRGLGCGAKVEADAPKPQFEVRSKGPSQPSVLQNHTLAGNRGVDEYRLSADVLFGEVGAPVGRMNCEVENECAGC